MRIAVYGASGFTGRLTVAELGRRGIPVVLVGRSAGRLRVAAEEAGVSMAGADGGGAGGGADGEIRVAGLTEPAALAAAFADCDAVVNCAGPFTLWGEPVVRAAVAAGVHYVDTTGEQGYIRRVFDTFGADARRAGVSVVPAMADDGGPGDLIAALTAAALATPVDELLIADLRSAGGGASRGTARSMAEIAEAVPLEYLDGDWRRADAGFVPAPVEVPAAVPAVSAAPAAPAVSAAPAEAEDGAATGARTGAVSAAGPEAATVPVTAFALPGIVTIPQHVPARRVHSAIRAEVAALFGALTPEVADSVPEVVPDELRRASRWLMVAEATDKDGARARGWVTGPDGYGLTAVIAVEAALRLTSGAAPSGVLSPSQAFSPADFLDALAPHGVTWSVTPA